MDNGNIEEVNTQPDPDLQPTLGKPIIKLIWDDQAKGCSMAFDQKVFPNLEFVLSILQTQARYLQQRIRMAHEQRFAQEMMQQAQAQQLSNQIMGRRRL